MSKFRKKTKTKKLKNFPAGYLGRFYRNHAKDIDSSVNRGFYSKITNDTDVPSEDVPKYLLATSDLATAMEDGINLHVTRDRLNSASCRQKLDSMAKKICRR